MVDDGFWKKAKKQKKEPLKTWIIGALFLGALGLASYFYGYYKEDVAHFFSPKSSQQEDITVKLPIGITSCQRVGEYIKLEGNILNNSRKTVNFVILKLYWTDQGGEVIDTGSAYAVGPESLRPGESSTFVGLTRHSAARHCGAELLDFSIVRP